MAISVGSVTQNGVTGYLSLSGSVVTITVSSTHLSWRINGTKSAGDHHSQTGSFYVNENRNSSATFVAEDNHTYAFQVASGGSWSDGDFFTVYLDSGNTGGSTGGGTGGVAWGFSAKDIYFGDNCSVTWVPASESSTYKLEFSFNGYSALTEPFIPGTSEFYTYNAHTLPLSAASNIPNAESVVVRVSIIEYSDFSCSTEIARGSTYFTATLKDSVIPTISSCKITSDNSNNATLSSWGVSLAKKTKLRVQANASGTYGSKIVSYTIAGDYNITVSANSSGALDYTGSAIATSGNKALTVTCMDSRGRVSSQKITNTILFLQYSDPKITKFSINKKTISGTDRMVVNASWIHDSIERHNTSSGKVYYRMTAGADWTLQSGTLTSGEEFTLSSLTLEQFTSYNFKLVVTDAIGGTASMESFASTTPVLLDFKAGGDGLGVGKVCESPGMEVSMDTTFFGNVYIGNKTRTLSEYITSISPTFDKIYPVGSIYMSMVATNPGQLFGGTWTQLPGRFLLGAGSNEANTSTAFGSLSTGAINRPAGEKGGEISHKLNVNEMPEHTHSMNSPAVDVRMYGGSGDYWPIQYSPNSSNSGLIQSSGGNEAHNNMPPYLAVYMWKRVS